MPTSTNQTSPSEVELGPWSQAVVALGLDHPALLRLSSTRTLMEEAHQIHEQRRALRTRLVDTRRQLADLLREEEAAIAAGLGALREIHAELEGHTADLVDASSRLRTSLTFEPAQADDFDGDDIDGFIARHALRDQYDTLLDMFSAFGAFDLRARTIRFHGAGGRMHQLPTFENIAAEILTADVRTYLAQSERVRLLITPVSDGRVFTGVGKTISFNNYAVSGVGREGPDACADFVQRLRDTRSGEPSADDLLRGSMFEGLRVSLYSESNNGKSQGELFGQGLSMEPIREDIAMNAMDAIDHGVDARPLSPPEYLLLQAIRRRFGVEMLDAEDGSHGRFETWFPSHQIAGTPGTLVARAVGSGLRFRADELGRGAEGRGYRMVYAPVAA